MMHSINKREHAGVFFSYLENISCFVDYSPLTDYFKDDTLDGVKKQPIYFPKYKFSYTTAKIVYLSNEINALTEILNEEYDDNILETVISKYVDLFTMAEFYVVNEASTPIREDTLVDVLRLKPLQCNELCYKYSYIEKDNSLFDAKYGFSSKIY